MLNYARIVNLADWSVQYSPTMWSMPNGDDRLLFLFGTFGPNVKSMPLVDPKI